jgi:hypothetical protein
MEPVSETSGLDGARTRGPIGAESVTELQIPSVLHVIDLASEGTEGHTSAGGARAAVHAEEIGAAVGPASR